MSAAEIIEIVDRHNFHRSNVAPTATDMLKMVSGDSITLKVCLFDLILYVPSTIFQL